jgi:biotin carboxyl carrier protein
MKYKVTVENQSFEVDIEDINSRPVLARVDGQVFEVTPGNGAHSEAKEPTRTGIALPGGSVSQQMSGSKMVAPLPGTVTEVFVKPGDKVEAGQVILVIEAMKMKNSIRSVRSGIIGEILVQAGQSVAHRQPLVGFADSGEASWI